MATMITCPKCNANNVDTAEWCVCCKNMLVKIEIPILAIQCPHCHSKTPDLANCEECGKPLDNVLATTR
jgi:hypothetical protein